MAHLSKRQLLEVIEQAIADSGWNVLCLSDRHPFRLQIYQGEASYRVRIYVWNLTHGGGAARPRDEYRIQVTGVSHFEPEIGGETLILGWWEAAEVFAAFDFQRHAGALGASPSLQIKEDALREAARTGFSPYNKGNQEIAIAFRPDFFVDYVRNLESLHSFGESDRDLEVLDAVSHDPLAVNDEDIEIVSQPRRTVVASVRRKLRSASFKLRVLEAYDHQCAMCGLQLRLVEAAHIIPVNHEASTDETRNGLALCVLHHRAFDRVLVTVNERYQVVVNSRKLDRLSTIGHGGGRTAFERGLRNEVVVPRAVTDRPHVDYLRLGNQVRGWGD